MFLLDVTVQKSSGLAGILEIPFNYIFEFFYNITPVGSLALAIIAFTVLIKLILLPLSIKQQKSMKLTQKMQPELVELQNKYKNKKDQESQAKMAEEMQAIYTKYNTNPLTGCLLPFIQIPIIYALFAVLKNACNCLTKLSNIYNTLAGEIMSAPGYETILSNLAKAKKINQAVDYSVLSNAKDLFTTLTSADWGALIGDLSDSINVDLVNQLINQKMQIESFFGINLINQPTITSLSVILPLLTVLVTYYSINMSMKEQKNTQMDEKTESMMKNMSTMNVFLIGLIFVSSMSLPAGLSLYWTLSNLWQFVQQKVLKMYFDKVDVGASKNDAITVNYKEVK